MSPSPRPLDRLRARIDELGAPLCLGIDPHPDELPEVLPSDVAGVERFARGLLEAVAEEAAAIKINVAFFEAWGAAGWAALERLRADVPADHVVILDAKRGDIGTTAERYAAGLLGHLAADGVTLASYLGADAVEPFLAYQDRLVYLLTRTSNPGAARVQDLIVEGGARLHEQVASWITEMWPGNPRVGLVVGATAAEELGRLRGLVPGPAFLVPGLGVQGGDLAAAVRHCHGSLAPGVVNVSRGIARASRGPDWAPAARQAARDWRARMTEAGGTLAAGNGSVVSG